jgi:Ran GTPase-activating protein (RanGAP) involved in mRNA processing and transport
MEASRDFSTVIQLVAEHAPFRDVKHMFALKNTVVSKILRNRVTGMYFQSFHSSFENSNSLNPSRWPNVKCIRIYTSVGDFFQRVADFGAWASVESIELLHVTTYTDVLDIFASSSSCFPCLRKLCMHHVSNPCGAALADAVLRAAPNFPLLEKLSLPNANITSIDMTVLLKSLQYWPQLKNLCMAFNWTGPVDIQNAVSSLAKYCTGMTQLNIGNSNFEVDSSHDEMQISDLASLANLKELYVPYMHLNSMHCTAMFDAMSSLTLLTGLFMSCNNIQNDGMEAMHRAAPSWKMLKTMAISSAGIGTIGCEYLSKSACHWPELTSLIVSLNDVDSSAGEYLSSALEQWPQLTYLDIGYMSLEDYGIRHIARGLSKCHNLKTLLVAHVDMTSVGAMEIARISTKLHCLEDLVLDRNPIGTHGFLAMALGTWPALKSLSMSECNITDREESGYSLKIMTRSMPHLRFIDISEACILLSALADACMEWDSMREVWGMSMEQSDFLTTMIPHVRFLPHIQTDDDEDSE